MYLKKIAKLIIMVEKGVITEKSTFFFEQPLSKAFYFVSLEGHL